MADEKQRNFGAATGDMNRQPDNRVEDDISQVTQPDKPDSDEADAWKSKYIQLLADLENTKKRLARSSAQEVEADRKALLREVLPVADGLDLALIHLSREDDSRNILSGVELIRNILDKFFIKYDVKAIDSWGKPFDPTLHEALGVVPHSKFPPNTVVRVEQKGYLYRDELLRPAKVLVVSSN
jgi:molecular chaperone GrpE